MVDLSPGSGHLLAHVRALEVERDFAGMVRLLEPVRPEELIAEPELGYHLAYAWRHLGRVSDALDLAAALELPVRRRAEPRLARRLLSLAAMLRYDRGDLAEAQRLWEELATVAEEAADHELATAARNNLGVVFTLRDRPGDALGHYNRALLASQRRGDRRALAQAHHNLAILFRELGATMEAEAHFQDAVTHARASGSDDILAGTEGERALLLLETGDERMALLTAERGLRRFTGLGDPSGEGEALRVLGIIALRQRDLDTAATRLEQALARARAVGHPLLEAETLEALALLGELERDAAALETRRSEAAALFQKMEASAWGGRVRRRTAALAGVPSSAAPGVPSSG